MEMAGAQTSTPALTDLDTFAQPVRQRPPLSRIPKPDDVANCLADCWNGHVLDVNFGVHDPSYFGFCFSFSVRRLMIRTKGSGAQVTSASTRISSSSVQSLAGFLGGFAALSVSG